LRQNVWYARPHAGRERAPDTQGSIIETLELQMMKPGLYANINAKRKRIAAGSGEKMRKPGAKGAPTAKAFRQSAKTAKTAKPAKAGALSKMAKPTKKK
jgi:hypothetical protein